MLEADALQDVVQLNVDAEIVGVQLELVAGLQTAIFVDVHGEGRNAAVDREFPVAEVAGSAVELDQFFAGSGLHGNLRRQLNVMREYNAVRQFRPEL